MKRTVYKNLVIDDILTDLTAEDGVIVSLERTTEDGYDCKGLTARAGLFDVHIHGLIGEDANANDGTLDKMSLALAKEGVTSWLPTVSPASFDDMEKACKAVSHAGAKVRGFHLEGPFVSLAKKGALNPIHIVPPTTELLDRCPRATYMTIAPETEGAIEFIKEATKRGVRLALGHSVATHDEALAGIRAGANSLTHTFNAMAPLDHREPGLIGAAITGDAYVQVISDGFHLHPAVVLALYRIFGAERMMLISDSVRPAGLPEGVYESSGKVVEVRNGQCYLKDSNTIAGATTLLSECVRRAVSFGIPEADAYRMASETPARFMGVKAGKLALGYDADFALYSKTNHAVLTVIDGEIVEF